MARILGIDYGRKRVGLAATDPLQIIVSNLTTVHSKDIFNFIEAYLKREDVESFVVGYPRKLNNQASESIEFINPFLKKLKKTYPNIPIYLEDERFTSKIAKQSMIDGGLKKKARRNKALVDTISANLILQTFLNSSKFKKEQL